MILDHVGLHVADIGKNRDVFLKALAPLQIALVSEGHGWGRFGRDRKGEVWVDNFGAAHAPIHLARQPH